MLTTRIQARLTSRQDRLSRDAMNRVLMICITLAFTTAAVFTAGPTLRARQDGPLPDYDDKEISERSKWSSSAHLNLTRPLVMCPHAEEVYYTGAGENVEDWPL